MAQQQRSPTAASYEEGPSLEDSGIGIDTTSTTPQRKAKQEVTLPVSPSSPSTQAKRRHGTLRATSEPALALASACSLLLPPQRPDTPVFPRFHAYSSTHDHGQQQQQQQAVERVLETPQGRKTPTLFSAPKPQWHLSRPFLLNPSESTVDSVNEEGSSADSSKSKDRNESESESGTKKGMGKKPNKDTTPPPSLHPHLARKLEAKQVRQRDVALGLSLQKRGGENEEQNAVSFSFSSPPSSSSSSSSFCSPSSPSSSSCRGQRASASSHYIASLNRTLDTNLRPQPYYLSSVSETSACNPVAYPRAKGGQRPSRQTPSSIASSMPSVRTASVLPVTRVTHADVVRAQVTIPTRDAHQEQAEEEEYRQLAELVRKRKKERASVKGRVKHVVKKVGTLCCQG